MKNPLFSFIVALPFLFCPGASGPGFHTIAYSQLPVGSSLDNGLFEREEPLELTLSGNLYTLFEDRSDDPDYHPLALSYTDGQGEQITIELKAKTRGNFRRSKSNCRYPPLWLNFAKKNTPENSVFHKQDKIKLVTPCISDKYIVREYLVYKLYNLITEKSFRARLVRVIYDDAEKGKRSEPLYGILLEEEDQMAERNQSVIVKTNFLHPLKTDTEVFRTMAVFQYLIGNTDWSVQYRHNIKLIASDTTATPVTVPYDFDHAGIVSAPYAKPAEALLMTSTRQRRYRGFCETGLEKFEPVFDRFNALKDDIYRIYTDCQMIDAKYQKATKKFLDKFYKTINHPKRRQYDFGYPCDKNGTGNVVIQGLGFKEE